MFGIKKPPQNFEEEYRAENYRFEKYRTEGTGALTDDALASQRSVWMGRPFPGQDCPPAVRSEKVLGYSERRMARRQRRMPSLLGNSPHDNDPGFRRARQRFREARDWFLAQGPFDFIRPLGYGGLGLTIQFRSRGENPIDVVLKIALDGWVNDDLRKEEMATRQLAGAAHCIQLNPERIGMKKQEPYKFAKPELMDSSSKGELSGVESPAGEPQKKVQRTRRARLADKEEASRMRKRRREMAKRDAEMEGKIRAPNRVLWSFWLCLVRACVAMEYPPRKFHPRRRQKDAEGEPPNAALAALALDDHHRDLNGKIMDGQLFEDVPGPKRRWARNRMVHFDIDPKNTMWSAVNSPIALNVKPNKSKYAMALYFPGPVLTNVAASTIFASGFKQRGGGQFGIEWDYVAPTDPFGPEMSEQTVAGNYGSPMNIWGIAGSRGPGPLTYCHLIRTDPKYNYVDLELKEVMAQCMRHDPKDRPSLLNLSRQTKTGIKRRYGNESDDFIRTWIHNALYNACSS
ncbi:hypothetical protein DL764_003700 [Monosporascus ibericus]|uniref:Protein kinase domain-containing protein n=1 Tax=Monosporascus ibericus TaxID=155417 RepID=A0A4Q4TIW4_9PEZI|nr:hypothetical protein DL764_003700 [Monosporascus ibericus]